MTVDYQPSGREFTGKHMLLVLFAFFGTIIAVNLLLSWFAVESWSGLVAKNGYVASIDFKDKREANDLQKKLGWTTSLTYSATKLAVEVRDKTGAVIKDLKIVANVRRPTTEKQDIPLAFRFANDGKYHANAKLAPGQWLLDLRASGDTSERYRKTYRFVIKAEN